jgi:hypothetical protein
MRRERGPAAWRQALNASIGTPLTGGIGALPSSRGDLAPDFLRGGRVAERPAAERIFRKLMSTTPTRALHPTES